MYNEPSSTENWDKRYYGIYRGVVVDTADPDNRGRITLQVPQILGHAVTGWAWPVIGVPENKKTPYGSFFDYTTQYAGTTGTAGTAVINTPVAMRLDTTDPMATQFTHVDGPNTSRVTFEKAGIYNFQWSAQFVNTNTAAQDVSAWLRQNGVDIPGSTGLISVPSKHGTTPGHSIVGWNYLINAEANDYIELWWTSSSTDVYIANYPGSTTPVYPTTASVVATADLIGGFKPLPADGCWVMFEGGDPNFPLWLGAF